MTPEPWDVDEVSGDAAALHRLGLPDPPRRLVRWCRPDGAALVLGSTQPDADHVAAAAAGLSVARRSSGGAAVVVGGGRLVWLDVIIPRSDPLWHDDIGKAPLWLGARLAGLSGPGAVVHAGAMVRTEWSSLVCFAGVGPGEVLDGAGRKVIGISQRRTREGALFQVAILLRWDPAEQVAGLALDPAARQRAVAALAAVAAPIHEPARAARPSRPSRPAQPAQLAKPPADDEALVARSAISATTSS